MWLWWAAVITGSRQQPTAQGRGSVRVVGKPQKCGDAAAKCPGAMHPSPVQSPPYLAWFAEKIRPVEQVVCLQLFLAMVTFELVGQFEVGVDEGAETSMVLCLQGLRPTAT